MIWYQTQVICCSCAILWAFSIGSMKNMINSNCWQKVKSALKSCFQKREAATLYVFVICASFNDPIFLFALFSRRPIPFWRTFIFNTWRRLAKNETFAKCAENCKQSVKLSSILLIPMWSDNCVWHEFENLLIRYYIIEVYILLYGI